MPIHDLEMDFNKIVPFGVHLCYELEIDFPQFADLQFQAAFRSYFRNRFFSEYMMNFTDQFIDIQGVR